MDRGDWQVTVHRVARYSLATKPPPPPKGPLHFSRTVRTSILCVMT